MPHAAAFFFSCGAASRAAGPNAFRAPVQALPCARLLALPVAVAASSSNRNTPIRGPRTVPAAAGAAWPQPSATQPSVESAIPAGRGKPCDGRLWLTPDPPPSCVSPAVPPLRRSSFHRLSIARAVRAGSRPSTSKAVHLAPHPATHCPNVSSSLALHLLLPLAIRLAWPPAPTCNVATIATPAAPDVAPPPSLSAQRRERRIGRTLGTVADLPKGG